MVSCWFLGRATRSFATLEQRRATDELTSDLKKQFEGETGHTLSVGVGADLVRSIAALEKDKGSKE